MRTRSLRALVGCSLVVALGLLGAAPAQGQGLQGVAGGHGALGANGALGAHSARRGHSVRGIDKVIVFGDSLSDMGRISVLTGGVQPPAAAGYYYGESPAMAETVVGGRFSNGPVWPEYLAAALGADLYNYAFGGAGTGAENEVPGLPPTGVLTQISLFLADVQAGRVVLGDPETCLFVVWAGANDLRDIASPAEALPVIQAAIGNLVTAVTTLVVEVGAEHILVPTPPNLGRTPEAMAGGPAVVQAATQLSLLMGVGLAATMDHLFPDEVEVPDAFSLTDLIVDFARAFGFRNSTQAHVPGHLGSGDDPNDFVFFDAIHPTTPVHQILADYYLRCARVAVRR